MIVLNCVLFKVWFEEDLKLVVCVDVLIIWGVDIYYDLVDGIICLVFVCKLGYEKIVEVLLEVECIL